MRCLVVHAHPDPRSFSGELCRRTVAGLTTAGHEIDVIDLYGDDYDPCMTADEHERYLRIGADGGAGHPDAVVRDHIERLQVADALVFVYPTWWSGLPAIMKGWLERTLLPGVAFTLTPAAAGVGGRTTVRANLGRVRRLIGVTTYGSRRLDVVALGDGGRRTISRTVRVLCHRRCRTAWLGLHSLDTASEQERMDFLDRVESTMAGL